MGPTGSPETSIRNYHYSLRNKPEKRSYQPSGSTNERNFLTRRGNISFSRKYLLHRHHVDKRTYVASGILISSVGSRVLYFLLSRDNFLNLGHSIEGEYEGVVRIQAARERAQWLAYMNVVITIRDLQKSRGFPPYFFSSWRSLFHGVRQNPHCHHKITYSRFIDKFRPIFLSFVLTEINSNSMGTKSDYNWK